MLGLPLSSPATTWRRNLPALRGSWVERAPLAPLTWFRTGGPAEVLFTPANEEDLGYALARLPPEVPVTVIGLGSNLIVRDGGVPGVVVRLGRAFAEIAPEGDLGVRSGAAAPDVKVARAAAERAIDGFTFLRGVPGCLGGALPTNAGAHGGDIAGIFVSARGVARDGSLRRFGLAEMRFSYRHSALPTDVIVTEVTLAGRPGDATAIQAEMNRVTAARESSQPIKERTGGSTFANPPGHSAWKLVDAAGCRGLAIGDAQVSPMHTNFLINRGQATSADVEALGEEVRRRVRGTSGVELRWEIRRIGVASAKR